MWLYGRWTRGWTFRSGLIFGAPLASCRCVPRCPGDWIEKQLAQTRAAYAETRDVWDTWRAWKETSSGWWTKPFRTISLDEFSDTLDVLNKRTRMLNKRLRNDATEMLQTSVGGWFVHKQMLVDLLNPNMQTVQRCTRPLCARTWASHRGAARLPSTCVGVHTTR